MKKVKIGIVEDETIVADTIRDALEDLGYEVAEPVISYSRALRMLETERPDLVLLDIQLAGNKDGVELAARIHEDYDLPFIFLTSHSDPATLERAKAANPHGYLVKPFNPEDLYTSIEVALHNYAKTHPERNEDDVSSPGVVLKDAVFIKQGQAYNKVMFDDIHYVKSDHVYVELHTPDRQFVVRNSLSNYMDLLPDYFYRIHRSYLINLHHLEAIESQDVVVMGRHLPIAKMYRSDLLAQIQKDS